MIILFLLGVSAYGQANKKEKLVSPEKTKKLLQGMWYQSEYQMFFIHGDSIDFIEHKEKYNYVISKDTLDILAIEPRYKRIILRLTKDSLVVKYLPQPGFPEFSLSKDEKIITYRKLKMEE